MEAGDGKARALDRLLEPGRLLLVERKDEDPERILGPALLVLLGVGAEDRQQPRVLVARRVKDLDVCEVEGGAISSKAFLSPSSDDRGRDGGRTLRDAGVGRELIRADGDADGLLHESGGEPTD
jgi:hypothetical protein